MIDIQQVSKRFGAQQVLTNVSAHFGRGQITRLGGAQRLGQIGAAQNRGGADVPGPRLCGPWTGGASARKWISPQYRLYHRPARFPGRPLPATLTCVIWRPSGAKIGKEQIFQAIQQVGLNPQDRKPVGKYSQGMRQRLGIAQALMEDPQLIILDEPMNALDNATVEQMRGVFSELKAAGKTLVITSHDERDIETLCDHVFAMDAGVLTQTR